MALHEAQEGTEKVKEELELERQDTTKLRLKLKEARRILSCLRLERSMIKYSIPFARVGQYLLQLGGVYKKNMAKESYWEHGLNTHVKTII